MKNSEESERNMELGLTIKIIGDESAIDGVIKALENHYYLRATSRMRENRGEPGYHLFVDLTPKQSEEDWAKLGDGR